MAKQHFLCYNHYFKKEEEGNELTKNTVPRVEVVGSSPRDLMDQLFDQDKVEIDWTTKCSVCFN